MPKKLKPLLTDEQIRAEGKTNAHRRSQWVQDTLTLISVSAMWVCATGVVTWLGIGVWHLIEVGDWNAFYENGKEAAKYVGGYILGQLHKLGLPKPEDKD